MQNFIITLIPIKSPWTTSFRRGFLYSDSKSIYSSTNHYHWQRRLPGMTFLIYLVSAIYWITKGKRTAPKVIVSSVILNYRYLWDYHSLVFLPIPILEILKWYKRLIQNIWLCSLDTAIIFARVSIVCQAVNSPLWHLWRFGPIHLLPDDDLTGRCKQPRPLQDSNLRLWRISISHDSVV